jgi:hypothetical protein
VAAVALAFLWAQEEGVRELEVWEQRMRMGEVEDVSGKN